jgi:hypothetical protein
MHRIMKSSRRRRGQTMENSSGSQRVKIDTLKTVLISINLKSIIISPRACVHQHLRSTQLRHQRIENYFRRYFKRHLFEYKISF